MQRHWKVGKRALFVRFHAACSWFIWCVNDFTSTTSFTSPPPSAPVSFPFHLIKINQQLLFGTTVVESERILPNSGLLVSVSRRAGLVSMVHCSAFLLPANALLAGTQLRPRLLKSVHTFLFSPLSHYDRFLKNTDNDIFFNIEFWLQ